MKRLLNKAIILALMAVTWVGCSQDEAMVDFESTIVQESESDIHINLNLNIPDPIQITSRSGDIEESIKDITVLCFDKNGLALTKLGTTPIPTSEESGTLNVKIPNATRIMHVFANQETIPFEKGMSEYDARLTDLSATRGTMIYWARIEVPSNLTTAAAVKDWWTSEGKTITLLRNQAKIEVKNNTNEFVFEGYTVVYTHAYGMAVPYYAEDGAYPTNTLEGNTPEFGLNDWIATDYIHSSTENETTSGTDENMLSEGEICYVYETPAEADLPASIIIKGYNTSDPDKQSKFWRVAFADEDGSQVNIRRNHHYTVSIEGAILGGDVTFEAAVANNSTANSAWLGIAEEVTAVKTNKFSLTVENTSYVKMNGTESLAFNFEIEQLGEEAFAASDLSVTWEAGQDVSNDNEVAYTSTLSKNSNGKDHFKGTVNVSLKKLATGKARQEGTIVIKYGKKLQRKVKVIVIPQQQFVIQSYNGVTTYKVDENTGDFVFEVSVNKDDYEKDEYTIDGAPVDKLKFSLPTGYPSQLLPFNVLVSTTDFNVVGTPLIFEGAGGYGDKNIGPGYKYLYAVDGSANEYEISLRYINNVLTDKVELTLEAENFKPVKLIINYTLKDSDSTSTEGGKNSDEEEDTDTEN